MSTRVTRNESRPSSTREIDVWIGGSNAERETVAGEIEALKVDIQPDHWSEWDKGFNAAIDQVVRHLRG